MRPIIVALTGLSAVALPAQAEVLDEVRFGVSQHNICVIDCNNADKEDGPNINGEIVFNSPDFLSFVWSPRPYLMASVNTAGKTSFGGVGIEWEVPLGEKWSLEPGVGYVLHDGTTKNPYANGDPLGDAFTQENVLLGSEDLFRTNLALNYNIDDTWGLQLMYEHLSHGQILGDGRNQGLDNLGIRVRYSFD